ncbi:hypothetical protein [Oryza sativa Japonica Group]|uniref:Uncharacterized protein n=1 Tax=Oryza sativa subsp. japonica TaxID=39947 RepID=Q5QN36_ORYSJ|nr:hypothetical protein [Oryza sativa Japonica Group]
MVASRDGGGDGFELVSAHGRYGSCKRRTRLGVLIDARGEPAAVVAAAYSPLDLAEGRAPPLPPLPSDLAEGRSPLLPPVSQATCRRRLPSYRIWRRGGRGRHCHLHQPAAGSAGEREESETREKGEREKRERVATSEC